MWLLSQFLNQGLWSGLLCNYCPPWPMMWTGQYHSWRPTCLHLPEKIKMSSCSPVSAYHEDAPAHLLPPSLPLFQPLDLTVPPDYYSLSTAPHTWSPNQAILPHYSPMSVALMISSYLAKTWCVHVDAIAFVGHVAPASAFVRGDKFLTKTHDFD